MKNSTNPAIPALLKALYLARGNIAVLEVYVATKTGNSYVRAIGRTKQLEMGK